MLFMLKPGSSHDEKTQEQICPTYRSTRTLLEATETLPPGPEFTHLIIEVIGDKLDAKGNPITEMANFWTGDPVACIRELLGHPGLKSETMYKPRAVKQK